MRPTDLFRHETRQQSERTKRIYAWFELAHTFVDFLAAMFFLVGSILFFWTATETLAIWLFVVGSVLFGVKPTLKVIREVRMLRVGDMSDLADREDNEP
ncbi:YrhK family protein [Palleronia pelagia]|uniref:YrhK-like protein n=1 Tax=Palleronia pelagia TaxID=387096 RepID=A0A1H8FTV3_9RHOB|nr:YrhK family protein [Palleronia pelagia]SEN35241.1 YrhK-like protein [Palleronia pelagia]